MIKLLAIIALLFSSQVYSSDGCDKIAKEFEQESYIYVICDDLAGIPLKEARTTIDTIFAQRKGPPDETLVYFITSAEHIGQHQFPAEVFVGWYYTHSNELTIWPEIPSKKQVYLLSSE